MTHARVTLWDTVPFATQIAHTGLRATTGGDAAHNIPHQVGDQLKVADKIKTHDETTLERGRDLIQTYEYPRPPQPGLVPFGG